MGASGWGSCLDYIKLLDQRLPLLHLKDYVIKDKGNEPFMAPIGHGNMNMPAICEAAAAAGTKWFIVEQDRDWEDPFVAAQQSFNYIKDQHMYLTGFTDEAGISLETQIKVTKELGWSNIEMRNVKVGEHEGGNLTNISDAAFDELAATLNDSGVGINCFGSAIGNWAKQIDRGEDASLEEAKAGRSAHAAPGHKTHPHYELQTAPWPGTGGPNV